MPNDVAASSPNNITSSTLYCVRKKMIKLISTSAKTVTFSHVADAKLPIDQNVTVFIPSALFERNTIKLVNAPNNELTMVPDKINLIEVIRPPIEENVKTKSDAIIAPTKAPNEIPADAR